MNCWEAMFIQRYHRRGELITEQQLYGNNPLFELIHETGTETSNTVTVQKPVLATGTSTTKGAHNLI